MQKDSGAHEVWEGRQVSAERRLNTQLQTHAQRHARHVCPCLHKNACLGAHTPHPWGFVHTHVHASGYPQAATHARLHMSRCPRVCIFPDRGTHRHVTRLFAPMRVFSPMGTHTGIHMCTPSCTLAHTNTNEEPGRILCLKKTCDCIKNVGHIGQIIKVRRRAVGFLPLSRGRPCWAVLGLAVSHIFEEEALYYSNLSPP